MEKIIGLYVKIEDLVTNLLMIGVVIFVFSAAVLRWVGHPIAWTVGFSEFIFVWVIFLGANKALRLDQHIGVDFFTKRMPEKARVILEIFFYILILAFLIYLSIEGIKLCISNYDRTINNLAISYSFVTLAVPVGSLLMCGTLISKIYVQFNLFIKNTK